MTLPHCRKGVVVRCAPAYQACWCVRIDGEFDEYGCPVFVWIR